MSVSVLGISVMGLMHVTAGVKRIELCVKLCVGLCIELCIAVTKRKIIIKNNKANAKKTTKNNDKCTNSGFIGLLVPFVYLLLAT